MDADEVPLGKDDKPLQRDKRASDERRVAGRDSWVICSLLTRRRTLATRAILASYLRASKQCVK